MRHFDIDIQEVFIPCFLLYFGCILTYWHPVRKTNELSQRVLYHNLTGVYSITTKLENW